MAIQALSSAASLSPSFPDTVEASMPHHLAESTAIQPLNSAAPLPSPIPDTEQRRHPSPPITDEYLAHCLVKLSQWRSSSGDCPPELPHKCTTCGKAFPSSQALGGHMSSHRKPGTHVRPVAPVSPVGSGVSPGSGRAHECNVCHTAFPTGQALGGHMRRHYLEGLAAEAAAAEAAAVAAASIPAVRDLDLDFPPPPESGFKCSTEEGEAAAQRALPFKKRQLAWNN